MRATWANAGKRRHFLHHNSAPAALRRFFPHTCGGRHLCESRRVGRRRYLALSAHQPFLHRVRAWRKVWITRTQHPHSLSAAAPCQPSTSAQSEPPMMLGIKKTKAHINMFTFLTRCFYSALAFSWFTFLCWCFENMNFFNFNDHFSIS